jgi:multiple sugar transport system permease protein
MEENGSKRRQAFVLALIGLYLVFSMGPLVWLFLSSIKTRMDLFSIPPKIFFKPTADGYNSLFVRTYKDGTTGKSEIVGTMVNSVLIAGIGTVLAIGMGTMAGYAASRFNFKGRGDFMFFVLSTRMLPPVAVLVSFHIMFSNIGLADTRFGMILLYILVNIGLATWIMKGFFDGVPQAVEEVALINGYSRFYAFRKLVLPMVKGGVAATTGFCFIFAWNEFTFASIISTTTAKTLPVRISAALGLEGLDWGMVSAAGILLIIPIVILFYLIRRHLLMGMTFGVLGRKQ